MPERLPIVKNWLPRFTLRVFLILVTTICVCVGLVVSRARRQRADVNAIQELGAHVTYAFELESLQNQNAIDDYLYRGLERAFLAELSARGVITSETATSTEQATSPGLMATIVGEHAFDQVAAVSTMNSRDVAELISHVNSLSSVKVLILDRSGIGDAELQMLEPNRSIERLDLQSNSITDAGLEHLTRFTNLRIVNVYNNPITEQGLRHFHKMHQLERICFLANDIPDEAIGELRKALPACHIAAVKLPGRKRSW